VNQTSPPVTIEESGDGLFVRMVRIDEPGRYRLQLDRDGAEATATFAAVVPVVADPSPFMVV
jgi:hypothetical protein